MATHSNIPAQNIPWTEEPSGLQSMGSQRTSPWGHTIKPLSTMAIKGQTRNKKLKRSVSFPTQVLEREMILQLCLLRETWQRG